MQGGGWSLEGKRNRGMRWQNEKEGRKEEKDEEEQEEEEGRRILKIKY